MNAPREYPLGLGEIVNWPGGYAMTLGHRNDGSCVRCCSGHESALDAKHHGLVSLMEVASVVADRSITEWAAAS